MDEDAKQNGERHSLRISMRRLIYAGKIRVLSIISGHSFKEPEVVAIFRTKNLGKE